MFAVGLMEFGAPEVLRVLEMDMPVCGDDEVLIKTEGASVNYADLQTRRGSYHAGGKVFPVIPGLDAAGIVVQTGKNVKKVQPGQRVIAFPHSGSYAEYVKADEKLVFPVPDAISPEQAIACPLVTFTSRMLLDMTAGLRKGETVLIHAASGGIGTTAIQTARNMGAALVIGTVGSEAKAEAALKAGADKVIVLSREVFPEKAREMTGGRGVDIILDSLGGKYTEQGLQCLAPYGRLIVFGNASGSYADISTSLLHASCRSLRGFSIGSTRKMAPELFSETADKVFRDMAAGTLTVPVAAAFPLREAAKAHALLEERRITGKIIMTSK